MKRIDRVLSSEILSTLLLKLYELRRKFGLNDAAMWDLINTYWYQLQTGKGITIYQLTRIRYRNQTTVPSIRERRSRLLKKGLITEIKGRAHLTELGVKEMVLLTSFGMDQLVKTLPSADRKSRTQAA